MRDLPVTASDGTVLRVDRHPPAPKAAGRPGVVVWIRTPYGRAGMATIVRRFTRAGAHVLVEALRGTDGSGGAFDGIAVHPGDGADVAAWLRTRDWFPGTIVTWGLSAIGYATWALAATDVPEWRLAILQDSQSEIGDSTLYPGGIFAAATALSFASSVEWQRDHPRASLLRSLIASVLAARRAKKALATLPLGEVDTRLYGRPVPYLREWLARDGDAAYWRRLDLRGNAVRMPPAVHLATGWYDICLASTLRDYRALRDAGRRVRLVIGPWYHGRGATDKPYNVEVTGCLDGATVDPAVRLHLGGGAGWRELADWPPAGYRPVAWHLNGGGRLAPTPAADGDAPDRYRYDPADPTPAVGGAAENFDGNAGAKDNRRLEARPDVLTFTSDPLGADVECVGEARARIFLRSSLAHTDLLVRVCDVDPSGRSVNVCDGGRRLVLDGGVHPVDVDLVGIGYVFRAGHRLRVQVSSGAHPRLHRNTGTGEPIATATRMVAADQEIFHEPAYPSTLFLPTAGVA